VNKPSGAWVANVDSGLDKQAAALLHEAGFRSSGEVAAPHLPPDLDEGANLRTVARARTLLARAGYTTGVAHHDPARRAVDSAARTAGEAAEASATALFDLAGTHDAALFLAHIAQVDPDLHIGPTRLLRALADRLVFHDDPAVGVVARKLQDTVAELSVALAALDRLSDDLLKQPNLPLPAHGYRPAPILAAPEPARSAAPANAEGRPASRVRFNPRAAAAAAPPVPPPAVSRVRRSP